MGCKDALGIVRQVVHNSNIFLPYWFDIGADIGGNVNAATLKIV